MVAIFTMLLKLEKEDDKRLSNLVDAKQSEVEVALRSPHVINLLVKIDAEEKLALETMTFEPTTTITIYRIVY